jgi:hypothetical protein
MGSRHRSTLLGVLLGVSVLPSAARADTAAVVASQPAPAEDEPSSPPVAHAPGEPVAIGRVVDAGPGAPALSLLSAAGFGTMGSVLGNGDSHDRLAGRLIIDGRVLPWLGLALHLDGRYDRHDLPGQPVDSGYVGDPRIYARADKRLSGAFRVGARAGLWLPGASAPSLPLGAASPELALLGTYAPPKLPLSISVNAGYRLDRSAHTAENAAMLAPSDRLALGVSDFDAVLLGAGASVGRGRLQGYVEGSWEMLVGARAPGALTSPIYLGAGARAAIRPELRAEVGIEVSPSERPDLSASAPLVVVPPRFAGWVGLNYRFGGEADRPPRRAPSPPPPAAPPASAQTAEEPADEKPETVPGPGSQLRGLVRSLRGSAVAAEVEIEPVGDQAADRGSTRKVHATLGQFQLDVPPGEYEVRIVAPGFESQRRRVRVEDNGVTLLDVDLKVAR